ncbi:hypothetical protein [uncultured Sphingomonas sp.]|uniref:hypothetical protein n=1 Tax=uncultured Sphingomonas sp. TaxID=158754 RepID=UPI0025CD1061|nr:hypothetical protein [uncultured Sphingomonas sp.]
MHNIDMSDPGLVDYFAFLEDVSTFDAKFDPDGPDGEPLRERPDILSEAFARARFSGLRVGDLAYLMEYVGALPDVDITEAQRIRRREELNRAFESIALPVIDIYSAGSVEPLRYHWRGRLRRPSPGVWFRILAVRGGAVTSHTPVFVGESEFDRPRDDFGSGRLVALRRAEPQAIRFLRNIFTLDHLPDADFDEDTDGPGSGSPPDGGAPPAPDEARTTQNLQTAQRTAVSTTTEPYWAERLPRDDDRQRVVVSY